MNPFYCFPFKPFVMEKHTGWNTCLKLVSENISSQNFNTWFKPIKLLSINEDHLEVEVPNRFFQDWLKELDGSLKYRVQARIFKLKEDGHFGNSRDLGEGLFELKFKKLGGGIRIYYGQDGKTLVILLCGGNKSSQSSDIKKARKYWDNYLNRG